MNKCLIILILAFATLVSCNSSNGDADAWGNFEARETIISAQAAGKLLHLNVERGQLLSSNVLVGLVDTTQIALSHQLLNARKMAIQTRFADVAAQIGVLQTQKDNINRELERAHRLLADKAATQQLVDDLEGKIALINSQIEAARVSRNAIQAELNTMDAQLAISREQWNNCIITNPIEGTVLEKYAEPHELVAPGKPLYKIADLSIIELRVYVSGNQLASLSLGQKVEVFADNGSEKINVHDGTINWIASGAEFTPKTIQTREERVNQVYAVLISVPNDGSIKIGMPGEVKF